MTARKPKPKPADQIEDSPAYLAEWSAKLRGALSEEEIAMLRADYLAIARNPRLAPEDRSRARRRARALNETTP